MSNTMLRRALVVLLAFAASGSIAVGQTIDLYLINTFTVSTGVGTPVTAVTVDTATSTCATYPHPAGRVRVLDSNPLTLKEFDFCSTPIIPTTAFTAGTTPPLPLPTAGVPCSVITPPVPVAYPTGYSPALGSPNDIATNHYTGLRYYGGMVAGTTDKYGVRIGEAPSGGFLVQFQSPPGPNGALLNPYGLAYNSTNGNLFLAAGYDLNTWIYEINLSGTQPQGTILACHPISIVTPAPTQIPIFGGMTYDPFNSKLLLVAGVGGGLGTRIYSWDPNTPANPVAVEVANLCSWGAFNLTAIDYNPTLRVLAVVGDPALTKVWLFHYEPTPSAFTTFARSNCSGTLTLSVANVEDAAIEGWTVLATGAPNPLPTIPGGGSLFGMDPTDTYLNWLLAGFPTAAPGLVAHWTYPVTGMWPVITVSGTVPGMTAGTIVPSGTLLDVLSVQYVNGSWIPSNVARVKL